jgi:hypothetical protein
MESLTEIQSALSDTQEYAQTTHDEIEELKRG